jgi:hypothetical protein
MATLAALGLGVPFGLVVLMFCIRALPLGLDIPLGLVNGKKLALPFVFEMCTALVLGALANGVARTLAPGWPRAMFGADAGFTMLGTAIVRWLFGGGCFSQAAMLAVFFIWGVVALPPKSYRLSDRLLVVPGLATSAACLIPFVVLGATAGMLLPGHLAHDAQYIAAELGALLGFGTGAVLSAFIRSFGPQPQST